MIKKVKVLFLSILVLFGLASCVQTQSNNKYSFKDITNCEVADIVNVSISYSSTLSSIDNFDGNYKEILDVDYILSDMSYNETKNIIEDYKFCLFIDFNSNDSKVYDIEIFVYEYKLYYFSSDSLYESLEKVNYDDFYTIKTPIEEVHTLNLFVMYDYGVLVDNKITTLLGRNSIWFDPSDYGIDSLFAGDELVIKYTGEYEVQEVYPGIVNADKMHIQSIEVIEADIVEFEVIDSLESIDLVPVDSKYNNYILSNSEGYVVSKDGSFKKFNEFSNGTILYASLPKSTNLIRVDGLYDYNPRDEQVVPTGQFEVEIIDKGNFIIDNLSNDSKMYTPGDVLEFYSYPIMDVDLAMYVNDEFYKTQETIEINDEYIWKYTFVMPAYDVVIEFKTYSIEYLDVRNVLNIPFLSVDEVLKVRYEHGYIGVAPGSLTDIKYSTHYEDIINVLSILEMPVYEDQSNNWQVTGGSYSCYSIITENQQYDICVSNDYISINQKHYRFIGEYITFEYVDVSAYSYITYLDTYEAYTLDGVKIGDFDGLSEYEFIECDYEIPPERKDLGYLETEFGKIYILSENIFYVEEEKGFSSYLIIGDKTFSNIFNSN